MKQMTTLLAFVLLVGVTAVAQVPPGIGAASFSRIGIDARPMAMGGAFVAMLQGPSIPYYNPASLVGKDPLSIGGMYSEPYGEDLGISFQSFGATAELGEREEPSRVVGVGLSVIQLRIDDIPIWDEDDPGASGFFTATSAVYLVSAAIPVFEEWALGASAKVYSEHILEGRGQGLGFDLGLLGGFEVEGIPISFGLNAMDVGRTRIRWRGTEGEPVNYVTWTNKIGATAKLWEERVLLACDFDWAVGRPAREQVAHVGLEFKPFDVVLLRGGVQTDLEGSLSVSAGFGLRVLDRYAIDYAYLPGKELGSTHVLSIQLALFQYDESES